MIADNTIHAQHGLGASQDYSQTSGAGSWLGRTIQVLKVVTCLVSGAAAVAAWASGLYALSAVFGLVSVVSGFAMLFGSSKHTVESSGASLQSQSGDSDEIEAFDPKSTDQSGLVTPTYIYNTPSSVNQSAAPFTEMRPSTVYANPDYGSRLPPAELLRCQHSLEDGHREVFAALDAMRLYSSPDCCLSVYKKHINILRTKEPFDDKTFLDLARYLAADQSVIDGHRHLNKSEKIQLLEGLYRQLENIPALQLRYANAQLVNLENIKRSFELYTEGARLCSLSDPVPDNEMVQMKQHVDALDTLLSSVRRGSLGLLVDTHDSLQDRLSKAAEAIKRCRSILNRTDRKWG